MMEYVQNFFNLMDLPGSSVRDVLAGENPFDQWSSPLSGKNRVSGSQLVSKYTGSDPDSWGTFIAGLGTEILTDPVNLVGGGSLIRNLVHAKQFNNAARAANAAEAGKYSFMNRAASSPLIPEATPASEQVLKLGYSPLVPPLKSEAAEVISRRGIDESSPVREIADQLKQQGVNPTEVEEVAWDTLGREYDEYGEIVEGKAPPFGQVAKERVEDLRVHKFDDQTGPSRNPEMSEDWGITDVFFGSRLSDWDRRYHDTMTDSLQEVIDDFGSIPYANGGDVAPPFLREDQVSEIVADRIYSKAMKEQILSVMEKKIQTLPNKADPRIWKAFVSSTGKFLNNVADDDVVARVIAGSTTPEGLMDSLRKNIEDIAPVAQGPWDPVAAVRDGVTPLRGDNRWIPEEEALANEILQTGSFMPYMRNRNVSVPEEEVARAWQKGMNYVTESAHKMHADLSTEFDAVAGHLYGDSPLGTGALGRSMYDDYSLKTSGKFGDGKYEEYLFTHPTATAWSHWNHTRSPIKQADRKSRGIVGHVRAVWNDKEAIIGELQSDYHQNAQRLGYLGDKFVKKPRSVTEEYYFKGRRPTKEMMDRVYEVHDREDFVPDFHYFGGGQIDKAEYEKLLANPSSEWKVMKQAKQYEVTHELEGNPNVVIAKDVANSRPGKLGQQRFVVMNKRKDGTLSFDAGQMFPEEVDLKFANDQARVFRNSLILPPEKKTPLSLEGSQRSRLRRWWMSMPKS
jgi:hypothetical protein